MQQTQRNRASARAFLKYDGFNFIVDTCCLVSENSWKHWYDEDGNKLTIRNDGKTLIKKSKTNIQKTKDLFKKSLPDHIKANSKWAMVFSNKNKKIIVLLGNDNHLRVCYFEKEKWIKNISPLLLGFNTLKTIEKYSMTEMDKIETSINLFMVKNCFCLLLPNIRKT